jgi:hypothetical protein
MARNQKRVTAKEKETDNEKYGALTISPPGFKKHTVLFSFATSMPTLIIVFSFLFLVFCNVPAKTYYDSFW